MVILIIVLNNVFIRCMLETTQYKRVKPKEM
nr:MAG TPA: hypothetical protein [Bacteriophage sp.]